MVWEKKYIFKGLARGMPPSIEPSNLFFLVLFDGLVALSGFCFSTSRGDFAYPIMLESVCYRKTPVFW